MSRHTSPGPPLHVPQVFQAASTPSSLPPPNTNNRQKSKTFTPGIAAGAEDVKYQAKYKELKRKVKEIEADNDKLQFKVLQAKKSINRMKIERAVLYDRLSQVPPSPDMSDRQPLPPVHSGPGIPPPPPPPPQSLHHSPYMSGPGTYPPHDIPLDTINDRVRGEYLHTTHSHPRMGTGPDGRSVQDVLSMGPGVAPPPPSSSMQNTVPPPPSSASSRHGHDSPHQLPPLMSKMGPGAPSHLDSPRSHGHPYSPQMPPHTGTSHTHSHSNSRSHSSSRSRTHHQAPAQYAQHPSDGVLPSAQHLRSPPLPGEREREREREKSRRHEGHERTASHSRHHIPVTRNPMHSPPGTRMSSRIHQLHTDRSPMTQSELERERDHELEEREWENEQRLIAREQLYERDQMTRDRDATTGHSQHQYNHYHRIPSPPIAHRPSQQMMGRSGDYQESPPFKSREEQSYSRDLGNKLSRSGTPLSGSGGSGLADSGMPRPDSRGGVSGGGGNGQYYDRDRMRPYTSRQPPAEDEYMHEERRPHSRDHGAGGFVLERPYPETRKRTHHDMEVDSEGEGEAPSALMGGPRKRVHHDHTSAPGADSQGEDEGIDA